jgi:hypothetical protein
MNFRLASLIPDGEACNDRLEIIKNPRANVVQIYNSQIFKLLTNKFVNTYNIFYSAKHCRK